MAINEKEDMHKLIQDLYDEAVKRLEQCNTPQACDELKRDWKRAMKEIDIALWRG